MTLPVSRFYTVPWKNAHVEVTAIYTIDKPDTPLCYCLHSADAVAVIKELNLQGRYSVPKPS
jgi:hypothetical protein